MTKEQYFELKEMLKQESSNLRFIKKEVRETQSRKSRGLTIEPGSFYSQSEYDTKRHAFRTKHIFMCLLRGRTRSQIENNFDQHLIRWVENSIELLCRQYDIHYEIDEIGRVISVRRDWVKDKAA
jgi:hypothetical protein